MTSATALGQTFAVVNDTICHSWLHGETATAKARRFPAGYTADVIDGDAGSVTLQCGIVTIQVDAGQLQRDWRAVE